MFLARILRWPTFCLLAVTVFSLLVSASLQAAAPAEEVYNLTKGQPVPIAAKKTKLPLIIYGEEKGASGVYAPSGYMGDASSLKIKSVDFSAPLSTGTGALCIKFQYLAKGREGWAGLYWQSPANNWGKIKGAGFNLMEAKKITFWARGENGGEKIADFKFGGLVGPYPDTDAGSTGPIKLNKEWTQYTIDLTDKDLRHIVGGFAMMVKRSDNPRGAVFYLDEIIYQGEGGIVAPTTPMAAAPVPEVVTSAVPATPKLPRTVKMVITFPTAKVNFSNDGQEILNELAATALKYPDAKVIIAGHTDNVGPASTNLKLSILRAEGTADYLANKGVPRERMSVDGFGETQPLHEEIMNTQRGWTENRRVEVTLSEK